MKLEKIYFDAFRSLLNLELAINNNCMGFVGTNESGKSNILYAIHKLDSNYELTTKDTPKMEKTVNPSIQFEFIPNAELIEKIKNHVSKWIQENTLISEEILSLEFKIQYHVTFNKEKNKEERFFFIEDLFQNNDYYILRHDKLIKDFEIKYKDSFIPLNKALIVKKSDIDLNQQIINDISELDKLNDEILYLENEIQNEAAKESSDKSPKQNSEAEVINDNEKIDSNNLQTNKTILLKKQKDLRKLQEQRTKLFTSVNSNNLYVKLNKIKEELKNNEAKLNDYKKQLTSNNTNISQLEKVNPPSVEQQDQLGQYPKKQKNLEKQIQEIEIKNQNQNKFLEEIIKPIEEKYTKKFSEIYKHLNFENNDLIMDFLPKVVFWEYNKNYLLQSETLFSEILDKERLIDISRPLVNVFRIGLDIKTMEDLKSKIEEIQTDHNERSRLETILNSKINKYIKSVWNDYSQEMNISLEKERIRIEIFDPECENASYYNMSERSQGCQTFISFLLTIGVEAKHGVINNTILLLDEPETHLHPSGVRFMLQELLKISENNNQVFFATHSIFMIDKNNYDRHVILEKKNEKTVIKPAQLNRIGYFMQEEVLYSTLDIDLSKDFNSTNKFNFVFEGDGDAILFKYFYNSLSESHRPFAINNTSFYQGGKCSDIKKYFTHRPIQLGTKWVFILDLDKPAKKLKEFIDGKYRNYINQDIFVFQYQKDDFGNIELEDLLPNNYIKDVIIETFEYLDIHKESEEIDQILKSNISFADYITKIIPSNIKKEFFKEIFKDKLNNKIRQEIEQITEDKFKKTFNDYHVWAKNSTDSILDHIKVKNNPELPKQKDKGKKKNIEKNN